MTSDMPDPNNLVPILDTAVLRERREIKEENQRLYAKTAQGFLDIAASLTFDPSLKPGERPVMVHASDYGHVEVAIGEEHNELVEASFYSPMHRILVRKSKAGSYHIDVEELTRLTGDATSARYVPGTGAPYYRNVFPENIIQEQAELTRLVRVAIGKEKPNKIERAVAKSKLLKATAARAVGSLLTRQHRP